jgi:hypothetical protein
LAVVDITDLLGESMEMTSYLILRPTTAQGMRRPVDGHGTKGTNDDLFVGGGP